MQTIEDFRSRVLVAATSGATLRIRGGGTKDWYGQRIDGAILDTRGHQGIVDYEPTELVITARAGTPLAEIEETLAERGQMLAFEPPHFGAGATLGGAIAAGMAGPRRASVGAVRDFILGAKVMDGRGEVLNFGGRVMKNVAGYDISRMMAGSLGTLGLLLEVSVKVLPLPFSELTLRFEMNESAALDQLNAWGARPLPISASCWWSGVLMLRLSGAQASVAAARRALGGEVVADGAAFWADLREQHHRYFAGPAPLWRIAVPSATAALGLQGEQLIEWGGGQRWLRADSAQAQAIRARATACGGHATLFRGGDKHVGVFHPLAAGLEQINQRVRLAFDPRRVFDSGRMY